MKFLRTIRLDATDERVYERAARPGEWAVPGGFALSYSDIDPAALAGKHKQSLLHGFLGVESFGWSTLVSVAEITEEDYEEVVQRIARHFVERYGAPDLVAALPHARAEAEFAASLCTHPVNTVLTVEREVGPQGIEERFKVMIPRADWEAGGRAWAVAPDED
jgi:hypothetical protein